MAIGIKAKADKLAELQASLGKNDSAMADFQFRGASRGAPSRIRTRDRPGRNR